MSSVGGRAGAEYHTLEVQRASIEQVCRLRGYELIEIYTDENRSGKSRNRPEFQKAMARVMAGDAEAIAVWKVSRFSRNWAEAAEDTEALLDRGADLISGEETFDTTTTGGRLLLRIMFAMATWEREVLNEGWEVIKSKVVRERGATLGHAGLGYKSGPGGALVRDPETDWIVVEMFERRARGATIGDLARYLNETKPREKSVWGTKDARRILGRRAYLGEASWRDVVLPGAHDALVSVELFQKVQAMASEPVPLRVPESRSPRRSFPLSSFLRCSSCGGPMGGSMDNGVRPNYKCSRRAGGGCKQPLSISATVAEGFAMQEMENLARGTVADAASVDGALGRAQAAVDEATEALADVASLEMRRVLGEDWLPMMTKLRDEKTAAERLLSMERRSAGLPTLSAHWDDMTEEDRWTALRNAVSALVVLPAAKGRRPVERLRFVADDEADLIAPR